MRNIVGVEVSERKMRVDLDIDLQQNQREKSAIKFANKAAMSDRFRHWFPERRRPLYKRRGSVSYRKYEERTSRRESHYNSPINYMRRILNT